MNITNGIEKKLLKILAEGRKLVILMGEIKNIRRKKNIINKVILSKEQKAEIDEFFINNYGKKVKYHWHRLYQSYTGMFNKEYFPEVLFSCELEPLLNNKQIARVVGDKNLLCQFLGQVKGIHIPQTYVSCINGILRDENNNLINKEQVCSIISNKVCIIKKTIDTSSGRDVFVCDFIDGVDRKSHMTISEIIEDMGDNFIIQEKIIQHEDLMKLYPNSLNTFRVITYIANNKIFHAPIALRLARGGSDRDNIHYGGIVVGVEDNGSLFNKAFDEFGSDFTHHPDTKIEFSGYKINRIDEMIDCAKKLHACIPYLGIVSWDLSIDSEGLITLIEANTWGQSAWFPQMIQGKSLFGDNTAYMLDKISKRK